MRYPPEQKSETESRILQAAARSFREKGSGYNGIGAVMRKAGLTKGGFYRHFESKDDLYARAVERAFEEMAGKMVQVAGSAPPGRALQAIIETYLSLGHVESPGTGCVISTLGPEFSRQPMAVRKRVNRALMKYRERLLQFIPGSTDQEKRERFALIFPAMAGLLMTARALVDASARKDILSAGKAFLIKSFVPEPG
jgi:TetR/AcrR family transcriptional repressor of nem operon